MVGYEEFYEISNFGDAFSIRLNRQIKLKTNKYGYKELTTCVKIGNKWVLKTHLVHRVVAFAFIKNFFKKPQINHIDGNKGNNFVKNLEWCTRKENGTHAVKNGLYRTGENHPKSVMTKEKAIKIRSLRGKVFAKVIAKKYNISLETTYRILQGKIYI